jgi:hypothetical protein
MTPSNNDQNRKRRARNYMLAALLFGLVIIFYLLTMVRLGGAS